MKNSSKTVFTILMSLLIVGTSVGGGILALPLQTGLSGFIPSFFCFILVCFTMTFSGWVLFIKFVKHENEVNNIAALYHKELGPWAKHVNTLAYYLTFYGLLVAYLSGASSTLLSIIPQLQSIPYIHKIIIIVYFLIATSLIVFGAKIINRSNTVLSILLVGFFITLIILTSPYIDIKKVEYINWLKASASLPILATAFGYHPIVPVIYSHSSGKSFTKKNYLNILLLGIGIVFIFNMLWSFIVMGILPVMSNNSISITSALIKGVPATIPIAKVINSNTLLLVSIIFTFLAITTSYIGVGAGLLNYNEGLLAYHMKSTKTASVLITFFLPVLVALFYPGIFIKLLGLVGGIGVILSCGILPTLMGLKKDNPTYIKVFSALVIIVCIIIFLTECYLIA